jgi:prepilin-type N-terminal cleavage/methylation domain-containing protein
MYIEVRVDAMKHTRTGFSLIEVIIASAVAALLGGSLFMAYYQTNRSTIAMENKIETHEKLALLVQQFEHDISGACIPWQKKEKKKEGAAQKEEAAQPAAQPQKKEEKKITHIFYSTNKNGQLDTLTFITNNPMQVYWSSRAGQAKPYIARVVYRLEPEKPRKKGAQVQSYVLKRQESSNLDFDAFKTSEDAQAIRAYEVIDNIKELKITFGALLEKKEAEQKAGAQKQAAEKKEKKKKKETEYKTFDDWNMEQTQEKESESERRRVPHEVLVSLALWNDQQTKASPFNFTIAIEPDLDAAALTDNESEQKAPEPSKQLMAEKKPMLNTMQRLLSGAEQILHEIGVA